MVFVNYRWYFSAVLAGSRGGHTLVSGNSGLELTLEPLHRRSTGTVPNNYWRRAPV